MRYIDEAPITNKRVLLRVDFNVSLNPNHTIADDARIRQAIPTIKYLLKHHNSLIIVSHLGRPEGPDPSLSLRIAIRKLQEYIPGHRILFIQDFRSLTADKLQHQTDHDIMLLENIRFYKEEGTNDPQFAHELASLADVFVNDAFGVSHRKDTSVVGIAKLLPSYGGLLMKKEVQTIGKAIAHPEKPFVAILGGAKISTKIKLISKLATIADSLLLGGGLANTFLLAQGKSIGESLAEKQKLDHAKKLLALCQAQNTTLLLPTDVVTGEQDDHDFPGEIKNVTEVTTDDIILDIGPETRKIYAGAITKARTIIWNGPMGYFENPHYQEGTDAVYDAIIASPQAVSIVGGGETIAALKHEHHLEKITHISTGGGAMLEFIENGTLPGIEALNNPS